MHCSGYAERLNIKYNIFGTEKNKIVKVDKFVPALIICVLIAYVFPHPAIGRAGDVLAVISTVGISLIFFFYGLRISPQKIIPGLKNWRLHILVQSATFIIFPLISLALYPFVGNEQHEILWLALFFMAVVPSTVSTSVIMVSIARGNIPAAIFNASISGIIGIIVTPLWMALFLKQTQPGFDFTEIYLRLFIGIILPVIAGLLIQKRLHNLVSGYIRELGIFDKSVILLIVYRSFAGSFNDSVFTDLAIIDLAGMAVIVAAMFFLVFGIVYIISSLLGFNIEDRITALFCGSQKSLVHGTVFSSVMFSGFHVAGLILIPLMLFHSLQILVISIIAARYGRVMKE